MTIIIKDVPGLTTREVLEALADIDPIDQPIVTGHGGFVVDEDTAERFLLAYLIASGKRPAPTGPPVAAESINGLVGKDDPTGSVPVRPTTRRAGKRKEA